MRGRVGILLLIALSALGVVAPAAHARPSARPAATDPATEGLRFVTVGRFDQPVYVTGAPGDPERLFVVERAGTIRVVVRGTTIRTPFLDVRRRVATGGERGLLSLAFDPDYARTGLLYICFAGKNGSIHVEEWRVASRDPDRVDPGSRRSVLIQPHPNQTHNGGQLQFGPDGYLYLGFGDGGASGDPQKNGQNLQTRLGKIIRFDPHLQRNGQRRGIPADNPFLGTPGAPPELFAIGFRNPWRFSFDRATGQIAIADVGQNEIEEISVRDRGQLAGRNFGWSRCEASAAFPNEGRPFKPCTLAGSVRPAIQQFHSQGYCAIIGGYVVRDPSLVGLYGRYVYGDFCRPALRVATIRQDRTATSEPLPLAVPRLSAFGQDTAGCIYTVSLLGLVQRIAPAAGGPACPQGTGPLARPPKDRRPPLVRVSVPATAAGLRTSVFGLRVGCDERCRIDGTAILTPARTFTRLVARRKVASGGLSAAVQFRLTAAVSRRLRRDRTATAAIRVVATDRAGNRKVVKRQLTLTR